MRTIQVGDFVADFELPDQFDVPRRLTDLLAKGPVVLFFYPAALSSGCTVESCAFRDLAQPFALVGAQPIGISTDPPATQREFDDTYLLRFPLLSDVEATVAASLGVKRRFLTPVKRVTLIIDQDQTVAKVIANEFFMNKHADDALTFLRERRTVS